jgi:heat-inducible transcriptional repressor
MADLDPRKQTILRAIIVEYVRSAEPVASELIAGKYDLGVKSATVRNEMAELLELGFLKQPHTSAGRIPSDLGYRYFVDRLIVEREPDETAKQQVKGAAHEGEALQALLRDVTRTLSRTTQLLSVATTFRDHDVTVRNSVVSALGPSQALLVLVLSNGHVENRMVEVPEGLTLEDVGRTNELLSSHASGKTLRALSRLKAPAGTGTPASDKLVGTLWSSLRAMARELIRGVMITEGEEYMFAQPEFQRDAGTFAELLHQLTDGDVLYESVAPGDSNMPQVVTIGEEHRHEEMRRMSVVRHTFFVGDSEAGVIAIVGPTRMAYESSIPLVNYTARALSHALTRFLG